MVLTVAWGTALFAQPANDICSNAISIDIAANAAACVWTNGTSVNVADGAAQVGPKVPCSTNAYRDDVWYKFSVPAGSNKSAITVKVEVGSLPSDMSAVGIAIYSSQDCSANNTPVSCFNFIAGADSKITFGAICGTDYLVRVWSATGTAADFKIGEGTFRVCSYFDDDPNQGTILWGANGEGSFNGGLAPWTGVSNAPCAAVPLWFWSKTTMCTKGAYIGTGGGGVINSLSSCNGAACFDSDFDDNKGVQGAFGTGICPSPQSGMLESPVIDLSGFPSVSGVSLVFTQALRQFQSQFFVEYSLDGGANWPFSIEINTVAEDPVLYAVNGPDVINTRRIVLPGAQGAANLKVRFRYEANYYYWIIDDVFITARENYNVRVNPFYAISGNKIWQKDQLEGFGGLADVINIGGKTAKNVKLKLEIADPNGIIFTDQLDYGDIQSDTLVQNLPMPGTFNHPNKNQVTYQGLYTVSADSTDFDLSDNTRLFDWTVSDTLMSKDNSNPVTGGVRPATDNNFLWGNIYHIVNGKNSNGKQLVTNFVDVGVANPEELEGATIFAWIYKWADTNEDQTVQETERTTLGYAQFTFPAGESSNTLYTLPIFDFLTFNPGIKLEDNTDYIVAVQYTAPADNTLLNCFISSDGTIDYSAHDLRTTLPGFGPVRQSHVLDVGNTGTFNVGTFTGGTVPVVRMHVTEGTGTNEPQLDAANTVVVAPNPVANDLNVKINLVKDAKTVKINIVDINGKVVLARELSNIKSTTETFNATDLANGTYLLNLSTDAGVRSIKFVVAK